MPQPSRSYQTTSRWEASSPSRASCPKTGFAAFGDDGDDLMMALACKIVSGEGQDRGRDGGGDLCPAIDTTSSVGMARVRSTLLRRSMVAPSCLVRQHNSHRRTRWGVQAPSIEAASM